MASDSPSPNRPALTLRQLNRMVSSALSVPQLAGAWVMAELSDVRVSGGHCYMELVEKNPATGNVEARLRGIIWASRYTALSAIFTRATGQRFTNGLKVLVCGSINYHPSFGISFVITDIDPSYTMGEAERLRREILTRLKAEGVIDLNRSLQWTDTPLRIAVISARGAAGYGDFINQLYNNSRHLRFTSRLFPAVLQGDRTAESVIAALEAVNDEADSWDCVVIIRGGGATSDLAAFDNYDIAYHITQFPLPVIVGIGHERDVTVLDFVANMRVKTPTAAAEWLIERCSKALDRLQSLGSGILLAVSERINGSHTQLSLIEGSLPIAPRAALDRATGRLARLLTTLQGASDRLTITARSRLDTYLQTLRMVSAQTIDRTARKLDATERLVDALSPLATLRRGYSLTSVGGRTVRSVADIAPGQEFETILADGRFKSTRNTSQKQN